MPLLELPYDLPGRVFRSEMPFSSYDPDRKLFLDYQEKQISTIVLLADDSECHRITGFDLRDYYLNQGMEVIYLPIADFCIPKLDNMIDAVNLASRRAHQGSNLVMHCHAGIGRTGMFAACLAVQNLGFSSVKAISWVRERIPGAIEVPEQIRIVELFSEGGFKLC